MKTKEELLAMGFPAEMKTDVESVRNTIHALNEANERIAQLEAALGECLQVLKYIGSGVSAHEMAKQYVDIHTSLLSDEDLKCANLRVKERYDRDMEEIYARAEGGK